MGSCKNHWFQNTLPREGKRGHFLSLKFPLCRGGYNHKGLDKRMYPKESRTMVGTQGALKTHWLSLYNALFQSSCSSSFQGTVNRKPHNTAVAQELSLEKETSDWGRREASLKTENAVQPVAKAEWRGEKDRLGPITEAPTPQSSAERNPSSSQTEVPEGQGWGASTGKNLGMPLWILHPGRIASLLLVLALPRRPQPQGQQCGT